MEPSLWVSFFQLSPADSGGRISFWKPKKLKEPLKSWNRSPLVKVPPRLVTMRVPLRVIMLTQVTVSLVPAALLISNRLVVVDEKLSAPLVKLSWPMPPCAPPGEIEPFTVTFAEMSPVPASKELDWMVRPLAKVDRKSVV